MKAKELFELPKSLQIFSEFFDPEAAPWEWVGCIKKALSGLDFSSLPDAKKKEEIPAGVAVEENVFIHKSVKLPPYAAINGPAWIGANTEIRIGAFVRGSVIAGEGCVLGNSCEFKNSLLMDDVATPHYNYVGDSILGNHSHLGAGVICANLRLDQKTVMVATPDGRVDSNLRKLGAILGDHAEAGCNAVLQPGSILMKKAIVLSCMAFSGYLPANVIAGERVEARRLPRFGF